MQRTIRRTTGVILWEGPSPLDGGPIVAILIFESANRKTGNIPQVWILRQDISPADAVRTGWDLSICGYCPYRMQPDSSRACYVDLSKAPASVWRTYQAGRYPTLAAMGAQTVARRIGNRPIRWGAYGDPAMIPAHVVAAVQALTNGGWRGYTHQWREPFAQWAVTMLMASVGNFAEYLEADAKGWKTFLVAPRGQTPSTGRQCPATIAGSVAQCRSCTQCDANHNHIWAPAHGSGAAYV